MELKTSEIAGRLKELADYNGLSIREFEKKIGVSNAYINSIRVSIQPRVLRRIVEQFPNVSVEWIMLGTSEMYPHVPVSVANSSPLEKNFVEVASMLTAAHQQIERLNTTVATLTAENIELKKVLVAGHSLPIVASENETTAGTRQKVA